MRFGLGTVRFWRVRYGLGGQSLVWEGKVWFGRVRFRRARFGVKVRFGRVWCLGMLAAAGERLIIAAYTLNSVPNTRPTVLLPSGGKTNAS